MRLDRTLCHVADPLTCAVQVIRSRCELRGQDRSVKTFSTSNITSVNCNLKTLLISSKVFTLTLSDYQYNKVLNNYNESLLQKKGGMLKNIESSKHK